MNDINSQKIIKEVLRQLHEKKNEEVEIPIGVSARHCHLSEKELEILFGKGVKLTKKIDLSQPGYFSANETVTIVGPKGCIEKVRILGPLRKHAQVEISKTDSIRLGVNPPIRESGNIHGSSPVTIVGPKGSVYLKEGLIIAQAHIHMPPSISRKLSLKDGDYVTVEIPNEKRPIRFEKVRIRVSENINLEMHIDTDEANAGSINTGQVGKIIKVGSKNDQSADH